MDQELESYIHNQMNEKDTEELVEIWVKNDRNEWSDMAFKAISEILRQRLGGLPEQEQPKKKQEATRVDHEHLSMISDRTRVISWFVLVVSIAYLCWGVFSVLSAGRSQNFLLALSSIVLVATLGFASFALLQAIPEILHLLAEVEDNTRRAAEALENR